MATDTMKPVVPSNQDRPTRRRPFSTWMKKITNFKSSDASKSKKKSHGSPYLPSNTLPSNGNQHSLSTIPTRRTASLTSSSHAPDGSARSFRSSVDAARRGEISAAPTIATDHATAKSTAGQSGNTAITGQAQTIRGADSTFSSPAPSIRSMTTTLTTVHSTSAALNNATINGNAAGLSGHTHNHSTGTMQGANTGSVHFSHQFPTSPPPRAIPGHLAPQTVTSGGHPATYNTATANGLLTDNASILTLASSSKRRRRRSMDTDASVRALAPSSLFGGSRESLPLSVLSSNVNEPANAIQARIGSERASIYSATGVAPALTSERNSSYGRPNQGGEGSVRSGVVGNSSAAAYAREGSISGSFVGSPLAGTAPPKDGGEK